MDFTFVIAWMARPSVGCVEGSGWLRPWMLIVGVCCGGWGWFMGGMSVGVAGNIMVACCRASLTVLGMCLYMF